MKQEINRKENIVGTEVVSDDCSIYQETIKLETEDIKKIIKHTGCPIFSLFLQGQSLLTDLQIRSKINGNTFDLGEYAYQNLDVIRISEPTKIIWRKLPPITAMPLTDEYKFWLTLLVNENTSLPKARAAGIYEIKDIFGIIPLLHELQHIELDHEKTVSMNEIKGALTVLNQENDASHFALLDFQNICEHLGLPNETLVKAKRLTEAMLYSYVFSFKNHFGDHRIPDPVTLLTEEEKEMIRYFIELSQF